MKSKRTTEDYVKTIYTLSRNGEVRRCQLAECLSVSRPTVSISIKALSEAGLVYTDDTNGIHLTESGLNIAKTVEEWHRVLCDLLVRLGVDETIASRDACRMEHVLGEESFLALKSLTQ